MMVRDESNLTSAAAPKWNRRKDARPFEIIEAATDVFVEYGFAAAKLDDIAKRAGVVKGSLYRYFDNKEELFRAVIQHAVAANFMEIERAAMTFRGELRQLVPMLLTRAADRMGDNRYPALVRMVIGESKAFPDLARVWHDNVVARILAVLSGPIRTAQERGEVHPGDPELYAFSIFGPMVTALLYQEVFGTLGIGKLDAGALALQHSDTVLRGILATSEQLFER